jgi:hypothetical protein
MVLRATLRATRDETGQSPANVDGEKPLRYRDFRSSANPEKHPKCPYGSEGWGFESLRAHGVVSRDITDGCLKTSWTIEVLAISVYRQMAFDAYVLRLDRRPPHAILA